MGNSSHPAGFLIAFRNVGGPENEGRAPQPADKIGQVELESELGKQSTPYDKAYWLSKSNLLRTPESNTPGIKIQIIRYFHVYIYL